MIDSFEDISLRILKTEDSETKLSKLIQHEDNLTDFLYKPTDVGYSPGMNFEAGRITGIKLESNKRFFLIETQQPIKSAMDGFVALNTRHLTTT